ncbi:MAG: ABC transporter ATP-binding protein [Alphaproteobacteria bacterium]
MANVLDIRNLSIDFETPRGHVHALRDVSFSVPEKSTVGIVGESGCGKTTVISAAMRLLADNADVVSGEVIFEGQDILKLSPAELRALRGERISMVFQDPMTAQNPVITIGQQMVDIQYRRNMTKAEKRRVAIDMLQRVGIPDSEQRIDQHPYQFSGGMRQRISIAMALLMNPSLLIADEPTTALDVTMEAQIIHLIRELQKEFQTSVLFVSHNLGLIAELCDFVVVMYAGEVVEQGSVRDIFYRPSHPYTQALLECDPARVMERTRHLQTIPGEVPDLNLIPTGCVFADRCPQAFEPCAGQRPADHPAPLADDGPDSRHVTRCHLLDPARARIVEPVGG